MSIDNPVQPSAGPITVTKSMTHLPGDANPHTESIFTLVGAVRLIEFYGICTEATNSATFGTLKFQTFSVAGSDISAASTTADNIAVGGMIAVMQSQILAATFINNSDGIVATGIGDKVFYESLLIEKTGGAATTVDIVYTGGAPTDVDMTYYAVYESIAGGSLAAV